MIDLRSDTITKASKQMLQAMVEAPVGDDVLGDDPSVNKLEKYVADFFGKPAAIFCPSGTMANQIALFLQSSAMEEIIIEQTSHVYFYETGGLAMHARSSVKLLNGERGKVNAQQVEQAINPDDVHRPRTSVVSVENTTNKGGGACYNLQELAAIKDVCQRHGIKFHLDGARVWNALVATNTAPEKMAQYFDTLSVCLSKGLGAPVGSVLLGEKELIEKARRVRKVMGGAMRQAGHMAAAGLFALEQNYQKLALDHQRAKEIEQVLKGLSWVESILPVETNIVIFKLSGEHKASDIVSKMKQEGVWANALDERSIRFVTHLDLSKDDIDSLKDKLRSFTP